MRAPRGVNNSPWQCCLPKLKLSWVLDVLTCPSHRSSIRTSCCRVWQNFQHCFLKALLCRDKKRVRRFTCSVRILSWCYVLCSHFSKLFPAGLTSVLSQGFLPLLHEGARGCGVLFLTSFGRAGGWDVLNLELSLKMAMKMTNKWPVQERGELGASWQEAVSLSAST